MQYFHVICTAGHDRPVFEEPSMFRDVQDGLAAVARSGATVSAFAVMSSHVHVLLGVPDEGLLPAAVSRIIGPPAQALNRRYQQRGSVFRHTYWRAQVVGSAYQWVLPLYIHANPAPNTVDACRLEVGARSSHAAYTGARGFDWLRPGPMLAQYGGQYRDALVAYLQARQSFRAGRRPIQGEAEAAVVAVARATGAAPSTLQDRTRGGRRDRMVLAWSLSRVIGPVRAAEVVGVSRQTVTLWARAVAGDATHAGIRAALGG